MLAYYICAYAQSIVFQAHRQCATDCVSLAFRRAYFFRIGWRNFHRVGEVKYG